ncbi:DUF2069 domain-containing protein [Motiliproteus sp. SC1-56]|uniref:DUF2069 domain-containing protein n=1 Tax=Motiliproteus sp. SC1-56 TaxID=2799565 RepID=UPI001A8FD29E|nr:DUF2069 domain-containing protein [Motiliproteus sp. SC1-56]
MKDSLRLKVQISGWLSRGSLLGLIAVITLWLFWLSPPERANPFSIWIFQVLPLLLFLPGVLAGKPRVHAWLCFVILLYFCGAVLTATVPQLRLYGLLQCLLTSVLFTSAMLYARWKSQWLRSQSAAEE